MPTQAGYAGGGGGDLAYLLCGADHAEVHGPGVSTGILRRLGPGGSEAPAGSSLGAGNQSHPRFCRRLTILEVAPLRPVPDHGMALLVPPLTNPTVFRLLLLLCFRLGKIGDSCAQTTVVRII